MSKSKDQKYSVSSAEDDWQTLDYLNNHPGYRSAYQFGATPEFLNFVSLHWPFCNEIAGPVPPLFLMQVLDLALLNRSQKWLVRDGLLPLIWFFRKFPRPNGVSSVLLIDSQWKGAVPESWQKHVNYWTLVRYKNEKPKQPEIILFCGLGLESAYLSSEFQRKMQESDWISRGEFSTCTRLVYFPARYTSSENESVFHANFFKLLYERLGCNCKAVNLTEVLAMADMSQVISTVLFSKYILSLDYVTSLVLSRGGNVFGLPTTDALPRLNASPYHGFLISEDHANAQNEKDFLHVLPEIIQSPLYTMNNWPKWFENWSRPGKGNSGRK